MSNLTQAQIKDQYLEAEKKKKNNSSPFSSDAGGQYYQSMYDTLDKQRENALKNQYIRAEKIKKYVPKVMQASGYGGSGFSESSLISAYNDNNAQMNSIESDFASKKNEILKQYADYQDSQKRYQDEQAWKEREYQDSQKQYQDQQAWNERAYQDSQKRYQDEQAWKEREYQDSQKQYQDQLDRYEREYQDSQKRYQDEQAWNEREYQDSQKQYDYEKQLNIYKEIIDGINSGVITKGNYDLSGLPEEYRSIAENYIDSYGKAEAGNKLEDMINTFYDSSIDDKDKPDSQEILDYISNNEYAKSILEDPAYSGLKSKIDRLKTDTENAQKIKDTQKTVPGYDGGNIIQIRDMTVQSFGSDKNKWDGINLIINDAKAGKLEGKYVNVNAQGRKPDYYYVKDGIFYHVDGSGVTDSNYWGHEKYGMTEADLSKLNNVKISFPGAS